MNIGIVCYPTYGGSGVIATELGKALAQQDHKVHFITYSQPVRLDIISENIFYHEVSVIDYPLFEYPPYELLLTNKMVDVVRFHKLDLLHVHYAIPHASAAWMANQILKQEGISIPFITTLHGTDITLLGKDESFEPVITFSMNNSNAVTSVSNWLKNETLKYFKVNRPIQVIPNFVCMNNYPEPPDLTLKKQYAPRGEKILIHVSNFRPVKRVEDVVYVFDRIRKILPAKLILVGDGPERPHVSALCRKLDTCNDIIQTGMVKSVEKLLPVADLFLLTSQHESFGLAALEAMAAGVPVIATAAGGTGEVVENGISGYLCKVGDIEEMVKKAISILSDEKIHAGFRQNAKIRAAYFDIEKIVPQYFKLYEEVLISHGV